MDVKRLSGSILTAREWIAGEVTFDGIVRSVDGTVVTDPVPPFILPGFVDLHVHGGGGADMMEGEEAIRTACRLHRRHGTTSMLATSVTAPFEAIGEFLGFVDRVVRQPHADEARVLGAHLEGPFINPGQLGAQPDHALPADLDTFRLWLDIADIKVMTLAPEMNFLESGVIDAARTSGVRVQLGHTLCDYASAQACISLGCGVTHLFNAMTPVAHRQNGLAGAALAHADYAEIIPDLLHVEPGAILAARRAIPRLYGVTDATAGAGMPDGVFRLGGHTVVRREGAMRLPDGTLAGSTLTMDQALRNLVAIGLPLAEAATRLSTYPADWIDRSDLGRIEAGAAADFVTLNGALEVIEVQVAGQGVTLTDTIERSRAWK